MMVVAVKMLRRGDDDNSDRLGGESYTQVIVVVDAVL